MKQKRVDMQGESAGEQARGKSWQSLRQKRQQKCKTTTSQTSKQVNVDGRGTRMPSTLPRLGPVFQGGDAEKTPTESSETLKEWGLHGGLGPRKGAWKSQGAPRPSEDPSIQAERTRAVLYFSLQ